VLTAAVIAALVFTFRVLAWRRSWQAPLAVRGWHRAGSSNGESKGRD